MTAADLKQNIRTAIIAARAVADAIRDLRQVPAGELYARLMGHMDLHTFNQIIGLLTRAGLVEQTDAHLLRWIGPAAPTTSPSVN